MYRPRGSLGFVLRNCIFVNVAAVAVVVVAVAVVFVAAAAAAIYRRLFYTTMLLLFVFPHKSPCDLNIKINMTVYTTIDLAWLIYVLAATIRPTI